jgi:hypothetical protein
MIPIQPFISNKGRKMSFKEGYGQARADAILRINEMLSYIEGSLRDPLEKPTEEAKKKLHAQKEMLRWMRSSLKGLKSPR